MNIRVYDITWDLLDEETGYEIDPKEEGLPEEIELEITENDSRASIKEKLFNEFGFGVKSFVWEKITLEDRIKNVLRRYFESDDNGNPNPKFDPDFTAQDAIDEIHDLLGGI